MKQDWNILKLGDACTLTMGQSPISESYNTDGDGLPFFQGCSDFGKINPTIRTYCNAPTKIAEANDVLMSVRAPIGTLNIANVKCCIGRGLASFRAKSRTTNSYLYYYLKYSRTKLESLGTGSTFKAIGKDALSKFPIPVPPIEEQRAICSLLDKLSLVIEKKKEQLKELDNLAQSIFYDMFGDPVTNERGWGVMGLNEVCDVRDGTHDSPKYIVGGEYILITSKNIVDGRIDYTNINYISKEDYDAINKRSEVDDGDIIMAMIGTIGKPIIVKKENYKFCIKNVALIKFCADSKVSNVYIQALLNSSSFSQYIVSKNQGGTQKFVALGTIRKLPIPIPPLPLQKSFAEKIETIEHQKELINQSIKDVQTLFDAKMDYYFGD